MASELARHPTGWGAKAASKPRASRAVAVAMEVARGMTSERKTKQKEKHALHKCLMLLIEGQGGGSLIIFA